jgi:hypothetical protein
MPRLALFLAALGLVLNSLDCYGAWLVNKQARECCKSGHCSRSNPDPCCKTAFPGAHQSFAGQQKIQIQPTLAIGGVTFPMAAPLLSATCAHEFLVGSDISPPLDFRSNSLPLLI